MIKIGYLVSYDYEYIFQSLDCTYKDADLIVISYDKNFKTWSGNPFVLPESFFERIKKYDVDNKIKIYSDNFFVQEMTKDPMSLETRQRNMLSEFMEVGGWHLQIDVDEYPYDFKQLVKFLKSISYMLKNPEKTPINIIAKWIVLFKQDKNGFYFINPIKENFYLATNFPNYSYARKSNADCMITNFYFVHQSWAREQYEIEQKIKNWSHKNDFDSEKYLNMWKKINNSNYKELKNFHPVNPTDWEYLEFIKAESIKDFIKNIKKLYKQPYYINELLKLQSFNKLNKFTKLRLTVLKFLLKNKIINRLIH